MKLLFQGCASIGQIAFFAIHSSRQWLWSACAHSPHTTGQFSVSLIPSEHWIAFPRKFGLAYSAILISHVSCEDCRMLVVSYPVEYWHLALCCRRNNIWGLAVGVISTNVWYAWVWYRCNLMWCGRRHPIVGRTKLWTTSISSRSGFLHALSICPPPTGISSSLKRRHVCVPVNSLYTALTRTQQKSEKEPSSSCWLWERNRNTFEHFTLEQGFYGVASNTGELQMRMIKWEHHNIYR